MIVRHCRRSFKTVWLVNKIIEENLLRSKGYTWWKFFWLHVRNGEDWPLPLASEFLGYERKFHRRVFQCSLMAKSKTKCNNHEENNNRTVLLFYYGNLLFVCILNTAWNSVSLTSKDYGRTGEKSQEVNKVDHRFGINCMILCPTK